MTGPARAVADQRILHDLSEAAARGPWSKRCRLVVPAVVVVLGLVTGPGGFPATARVLEGAGAVAPSTAAGRTVARFDWPVPGPVVATWDPPATRYSAGHRGVDLAVRPGERVTAMGDGVVGWAGIVAGTAWISVDHPGGIRTTVGPMATVVVTRGQPVIRGKVLGTATGRAHVGAEAVVAGLHVSARVDGDYVDPASLVGARLVPTLLGPLGIGLD